MWQAGWFSPYNLRPSYIPEQSTFLAGMVLNLGDQGLTSTVALLDDYSRTMLPAFALAQAIGFFMLVGFTLLLLRVAKFAAYTQNVSEPGFIPKVKAKREIRASAGKAVTPVAMPATMVERPQPISPFAIPNAGMYRCVISDYANRQLTVTVYPRFKTEPEFKILFRDVAYHAGAMQWDNAKFVVYDAAKRKDFMRKMGLAEGDIAPDANLYGTSGTVRIIAGSAEVVSL